MLISKMLKEKTPVANNITANFLKPPVWLKLFCCALLLLLPACSGESSSEFQNEGRALMQQGNPGGAVVFFKNALEKNPTDFETRLDLGIAYLQLGKVQQAEDEFQKCLRQKPDSQQVNIELAKIATLSGQHERSLAYLRVAEQGTPPTAESRELAGLAYMMDKNLDEAEKSLLQATQLDPKRESAQLALAQFYLAKRDPAKALEIVDKLLVANPANTQASFLRAEMAVRMEETPKAMEIYQGIIKRDPKNTAAHYMYAFLLLAEGKKAEATAARNVMQAETGNSSKLFMLNGLIAYQDGMFKDAADFFQQSVALEPTLEGLYRQGLALNNAGNQESALSALQKIIDVVPNHTPALQLYCDILLRQGRLDDAQQKAEALLVITPDNAMAHQLLGNVLNAKGDKEAAMRAFSRALELNPKMSDAALQRSSILISEGRYDEAKADLTKAVEGNADNINAQIALFNFYLGRRNYVEAERTVNAGLSSQPNNVALLTMQATLQAVRKQEKEAVATIEKARQVNPDYMPALVLQLRLYAVTGQNDKSLAACKEYLTRHPDDKEMLVTCAALLDMNGAREEATATLQKVYALGYQPALFIMVQREVANGKPEAAEALLQKELAASPSSILRDKLAELYFHNKKLDAAFALYEGITKSSPLEAASGKFRLLSAMGRYEEALAQARILEQNEQTYALGSLAVADILEHMGKKDQALSTLEQAYRKTQATPFLVAMAQLCLRTPDADKAETYYRTALQVDKDNVDALNGTAYIAMTRKKYDDAASVYERALRLRPADVGIANNLAMAYAESGREPERALDIASKAFALQPHNPNVQDTLAYSMLLNKRTDEAVAFLHDCIKMDPNAPSLWYRLGTALLETDKKEEGRQALEKALSLGNFADAEKAKALLNAKK